jgi:hypothetical protein
LENSNKNEFIFHDFPKIFWVKAQKK